MARKRSESSRAHSDSVNALRRHQSQAAKSLDAISVQLVDGEAKEPMELMEAKDQEAWLVASLKELRAKDPVNGQLLFEHFLEGRSIRA